MGSDESRFNVSLIVRDKVTRQCPQTIISEEKGEPKRNRAEALLLTSLITPYRTARPKRLTTSPLTVTILLYVHRSKDVIRDGDRGKGRESD